MKCLCWAVGRSDSLVASMAVWLVLVLSFVSCVLSQAPGDGDPLCIQAVVEKATRNRRIPMTFELC